MRVAVMQPYFYPYLGYFRLIAAVDLFVIFDCVQFPRRGRVHRCDLPDGQGGVRWLTLPLARQPRDVRICDLAFAPGAQATFAARLAAVPGLSPKILPGPVGQALSGGMTAPVDFIEANLRAASRYLGLATPMIRSSDLNIPPDLTGGARVRAVARACGATTYVNAPGGRELYAPEAFASAGLELRFLAPYEGSHTHALLALTHARQTDLAADAAAWKLEAP